MGASLGGALKQPLRDRLSLWLLPLQLEPEEGLALLSDQERAWCRQLPQALQARYHTSRALLRQRLAPLLRLAPAAVPLHSPPGAPPRLAPGAGFVSLSHSRQQLLLGWSPQPIGVDLEWAQRPLLAEALAQRFFPLAEQRQLHAMAPEARSRAVLESWVRKEAAIKWRGSSLASDLRHWQFDRACQQLIHLEAGWRPPSHCSLRDGWLCAVVGDGVGPGIWG
jgi:phosphopantetheinyl transferase